MQLLPLGHGKGIGLLAGQNVQGLILRQIAPKNGPIVQPHPEAVVGLFRPELFLDLLQLELLQIFQVLSPGLPKAQSHPLLHRCPVGPQ